MRTSWIVLLFVSMAVLASTTKAADPSLPEISGLTIPDKFPAGCVDCHVNMPERNMDVRISTHVREWHEGVEPPLLAKARAAAPESLELRGRHPKLEPEVFLDIPASCIKCHSLPESKAPPMVPLLHSIHLTGGKENHFVTVFKGECTHCHKLDSQTGKWTVPSGKEK